MIYTDMTKKALKLSFEAHKDQVDKSGIPYVYPPYHLAEQMTDENTTIVALLHDVAEDTDITVEDIRKLPISIPENDDEKEMLGKFFTAIDNLITLHQRKGFV